MGADETIIIVEFQGVAFAYSAENISMARHIFHSNVDAEDATNYTVRLRFDAQ